MSTTIEEHGDPPTRRDRRRRSRDRRCPPEDGEPEARAGGSADAAPSAALLPPGRTLVCKLPPRSRKLPATARHGLVGHLRQYPVVALATPRGRSLARDVLAALVTAVPETGGTCGPRHAGYGARARRPASPATARCQDFHSGGCQEPRGRTIFDPLRPKALIYANAPGQPLVLVGAMWSTRDGEVEPTPAGPILRWHSHVVCKEGKTRSHATSERPVPAEPPETGRERGAHVWFTKDLRSAFAISAPKPELCATDTASTRLLQASLAGASF